MSDDSGDLAAAEEVAREIIAAIGVAGGAAEFSKAYAAAADPHTVVLDAEIDAVVPILTRLVLAAKVEALEPLLSLAWHVRESGLDAWYIPAEAVRYALTRFRAQQEKPGV